MEKPKIIEVENGVVVAFFVKLHICVNQITMSVKQSN